MLDSTEQNTYDSRERLLLLTQSNQITIKSFLHIYYVNQITVLLFAMRSLFGVLQIFMY